MVRERFLAGLKQYVDPIDVFYGFLPAITGYAALVSWADLVVRAIRGETVKEDWRGWGSTAAFIAALTVVSGGRVRQTESLHSAAVEMRELLRDGTEEARRREQVADERDRRDSDRQERLHALTIWLVALAALTLAAAIVTLVVSIVGT